MVDLVERIKTHVRDVEGQVRARLRDSDDQRVDPVVEQAEDIGLRDVHQQRKSAKRGLSRHQRKKFLDRLEGSGPEDGEAEAEAGGKLSGGGGAPAAFRAGDHRKWALRCLEKHREPVDAGAMPLGKSLGLGLEQHRPRARLVGLLAAKKPAHAFVERDGGKRHQRAVHGFDEQKAPQGGVRRKALPCQCRGFSAVAGKKHRGEMRRRTVESGPSVELRVERGEVGQKLRSEREQENVFFERRQLEQRRDTIDRRRLAGLEHRLACLFIGRACCKGRRPLGVLVLLTRRGLRVIVEQGCNPGESGPHRQPVAVAPRMAVAVLCRALTGRDVHGYGPSVNSMPVSRLRAPSTCTATG